jgi:DNA-binding NarL/FixJ family response regulator
MKEIGLIEDDNILRNSYFKYFRATKSFNVVFSVADIADAIAVKASRPQIILLDINLPSGSGIERINLLNIHFPNSKIVILSSMEDEALTKQSLKNGAIGYLLKSSSMSYIVESLLKMDEGGSAFSPATITHVIQSGNNDEPQNKSTSFTKRELELIKLLSQGLANKTAADKLNVTYFTVNQHLKNIYKKLNINSKAELISWYLNKKVNI